MPNQALNSALLARGDALFVSGDFASARLFYERAANAGDGLAALPPSLPTGTSLPANLAYPTRKYC
jgi:hypothetical protein